METELKQAAKAHAQDLNIDLSEYLRQAIRDKLAAAGRDVPVNREINKRMKHGNRVGVNRQKSN